MSRYLTLTVPPERAGCTVKSLLLRELALSESLIARVKLRENGILLDGVRVRTTERAPAGGVLSVCIDDTRAAVYEPLARPLDILWEDGDLLILNKPAGMAVHGPASRGDATIAHALAAYLGPGTVFHPVTRLDRGTSGVMAVAKNGYLHERLRRVLHTDDFRREYLAVTEGIPTPAAGTIDAPIGREPGSALKRRICPDGAPAVTAYETLWADGGRALVLLRPQTGRTHQLRVHLASIGCPLAGEWLYTDPENESVYNVENFSPAAGPGTAPEDAAPPVIGRPALHSARLTLHHPLTGKRITAEAPLPADIRSLLPPEATIACGGAEGFF